MGPSSINGPFSMAMLNNQSVLFFEEFWDFALKFKVFPVISPRETWHATVGDRDLCYIYIIYCIYIHIYTHTYTYIYIHTHFPSYLGWRSQLASLFGLCDSPDLVLGFSWSFPPEAGNVTLNQAAYSIMTQELSQIAGFVVGKTPPVSNVAGKSSKQMEVSGWDKSSN